MVQNVTLQVQKNPQIKKGGKKTTWTQPPKYSKKKEQMAQTALTSARSAKDDCQCCRIEIDHFFGALSRLWVKAYLRVRLSQPIRERAVPYGRASWPIANEKGILSLWRRGDLPRESSGSLCKKQKTKNKTLKEIIKLMSCCYTSERQYNKNT